MGWRSEYVGSGVQVWLGLGAEMAEEGGPWVDESEDGLGLGVAGLDDRVRGGPGG